MTNENVWNSFTPSQIERPQKKHFGLNFKLGRETLLQNKRGFTAGHQARVLGVTRAQFLLYVLFELILEFIEGKTK